MCKFIGNSNERMLCKLSKSEILRLYSILLVAMETTNTSNFTCQSNCFISILFTCQVLACELQLFSCHDLANDIYSQTAKTVFSYLKRKKALDPGHGLLRRRLRPHVLLTPKYTSIVKIPVTHFNNSFFCLRHVRNYSIC